MTFVLLFFTALILSQSLVYYSFVKYLKTTKLYKPVYKYYALIPFIVFNLPFIIIAIVFGRYFEPPEWFRSIAMTPFWIWHGATFLIAIYLLIGKIIKLPFVLSIKALKLIQPVKKKIEELKSKPSLKKVDLARRKFLRTTTYAVSSYAFLGTTYGIIKHNKFIVENIKIKLLPANCELPQEFKGLTITLFSDIHAGQYMREHNMKMYADVVNELNSDIICIPGDLINFQLADTKNLTNAFKNLKAKYGIYGSLGNHDFFVDADYVEKVITNESPIKILRNDYHKISINGKDLYILGVDDTRDGGLGRLDVVIERIDYTIRITQFDNKNYSSSPKILLCHKPYFFDDISKRDIDLVLAGHTHGGQVVPFKFENLHLSFAGFISNYIEGLYTIGRKKMYVTRGIGTIILPVRLNCPPEITKITLA